ncbi:MAG: hypothetical protein ACM3SV_11705, partial [Betaproteobacteria bacterium]
MRYLLIFLDFVSLLVKLRRSVWQHGRRLNMKKKLQVALLVGALFGLGLNTPAVGAKKTTTTAKKTQAKSAKSVKRSRHAAPGIQKVSYKRQIRRAA